MTDVEWTAATAVEDDGAGPPVAEEWASVAVPGVPERFVGADRVLYRASLGDPTDDSTDHVMLTLRGLFAHARVWWNGALLGTHDAYFAPAHFVAKPEHANQLVVECRAPEDRFGGVFETDLIPTSRAVPGIWWGVEIEPFADAALGSLSIQPRLEGDGTAEGNDGGTLLVTLSVMAASDVDDRVTFTLRPEGHHGGGSMERAPVTVPAGQSTTVEREIEVRNPSRWWPAEFGKQNRYTVRAKLGDTVREATTGLASVSHDAEDGFRVNGQPVTGRGLSVLPGDDPDLVVQRARETNANLVRAHAHVPHPALHDACDEAGLLLWQDLPLSGPGGFDIERGRELAIALVAHYGHHPAIAAYGVHDDPRDPFASGLGSGHVAEWRRRWRSWRSSYDHTPDETLAESLPDERPVFPVCGPIGTDPDAAHLYPGWDYGRATDIEGLLDRDPSLGTVVGEFGAGALGSVPQGDEPIPGFDRAKHAAHASGDDVAGSQAYQAEVLGTVAETLRRREADAMVAFTLRDQGPAGMGVLEADGSPKAGFEALASAYEPVQAFLTGDAGEREIVVINDSRKPVEGTLVWTAGEHTGEAPVAVPAHGREVIGDVTVGGGGDGITLELAVGEQSIVNSYDRA